MILDVSQYQYMRSLSWRIFFQAHQFDSPQQAAARVVRYLNDVVYYFNSHVGEKHIDPRDLGYVVEELDGDSFAVNFGWVPQTLEFELLGGPSEGYAGSVPSATQLSGPFLTISKDGGKHQYDRYSWNTETRRWVFKHTKQVDNSWGLGHGPFSIGNLTY